MITVRVSKNLKGTLMISSLGNRSFKKNDEILVTDEQLNNKDVQIMIDKGFLVCSSNVKNTEKTFKVYNPKAGSVVLPNGQMLRAGKQAELNERYKRECEALVKRGFICFGDLTSEVEKLISEVNKSKKSKVDKISKKQKVDQPLMLDVSEDGKDFVVKKAAAVPKTKKSVKKEDNPLLIDTESPDDDEEVTESDERFVDLKATRISFKREK